MASVRGTVQGMLVPVEERNGLRLAIRPRTERSIGDVITDLQSSRLIAGVRLEERAAFADDRGFFTELARLGSDGLTLGAEADSDTRFQLSVALSYPAVIKAIHYHFSQTDFWFPITGMLQVALFDFRTESTTFGQINTLYLGVHRRWAIAIPPGVGHGYKVLGTEPAVLAYLTTRHYDPSDEGRLAYDHPAIHYDWEIQHK